MRLDLFMVARLAAEVGLVVRDVLPDAVNRVLESDVVLVFQDLPDANDCVVGFEGFGWHFHGDLQCPDKQGIFVE